MPTQSLPVTVWLNREWDWATRQKRLAYERAARMHRNAHGGAREGEGDPGGGPAGSGRSPPQSIQKEAGAG